MPLRNPVLMTNFAVLDTTSGADSLFALEAGFDGSSEEYLSRFRSLMVDMGERQRIYCAALFARKYENQNQKSIEIVGPYAEQARLILDRIVNQTKQAA